MANPMCASELRSQVLRAMGYRRANWKMTGIKLAHIAQVASAKASAAGYASLSPINLCDATLRTARSAPGRAKYSHKA
jgi:hypothetical protein